MYKNMHDGEFGSENHERTDNYGVKKDEMSSLNWLRP